MLKILASPAPGSGWYTTTSTFFLFASIHLFANTSSFCTAKVRFFYNSRKFQICFFIVRLLIIDRASLYL